MDRVYHSSVVVLVYDSRRACFDTIQSHPRSLPRPELRSVPPTATRTHVVVRRVASIVHATHGPFGPGRRRRRTFPVGIVVGPCLRQLVLAQRRQRLHHQVGWRLGNDRASQSRGGQHQQHAPEPLGLLLDCELDRCVLESGSRSSLLLLEAFPRRQQLGTGDLGTSQTAGHEADSGREFLGELQSVLVRSIALSAGNELFGAIVRGIRHARVLFSAGSVPPQPHNVQYIDGSTEAIDNERTRVVPVVPDQLFGKGRFLHPNGSTAVRQSHARTR
mmetsp:Transcript_17249/g.39657  ORF Transcript_17249/g.39657 Transcript_17249/m.39657 type:complete len:275 (+) Transcript_17249:114-938(+)